MEGSWVFAVATAGERAYAQATWVSSPMRNAAYDVIAERGKLSQTEVPKPPARNNNEFLLCAHNEAKNSPAQ